MGKEGIYRLHDVLGKKGYINCMMYGKEGTYRLHDVLGKKGHIDCMMYWERRDI